MALIIAASDDVNDIIRSENGVGTARISDGSKTVPGIAMHTPMPFSTSRRDRFGPVFLSGPFSRAAPLPSGGLVEKYMTPPHTREIESRFRSRLIAPIYQKIITALQARSTVI